jgi:hypothetical protein
MATQSGYYRNIVLKAGYTDGGAEHDEGIASGAISPGMNVVMTTATATDGVHTYAAGATPVGGTSAGAATPYIKIAKEDRLIGSTIDTAYATGARFFFHTCKPGDEIHVLVASGQTVVKGNLGAAVSSGKWNTATVNGVVEFLEATGGALAADTHVRAKVL